MFDKGLHKDNHPNYQPPGTWRGMKNGVINRQKGRIENEQGTETSAILTSGHYPIGHILIHTGEVILFLTNGLGTSVIGRFNPDDNTFTEIVYDVSWTDKLAFPANGRIEAEFRINSDGETIVYWTDNVNPPRYLNIDSVLDSFTQIDLNTLKLFPTIDSLANFNLISINEQGGSLLTGVYQFAVSYIDRDNTQTNYFLVSNPVSINDDSDLSSSNAYDGAPNDTLTGKSITFNLDTLDSNYQKVRIAVIKDQTEVFRLPDINIPSTSSSLNYTFTGLETLIDSSLDEVIINSVSYLTAKAMRQQEGVLYLGNLTKEQDLGFQKYANNIQVILETQELSSSFYNSASGNNILTDSYKDGSKSFELKGYRRDEVYAIYISFVLKDGSESKAYHIPGRAGLGGDSDAGKASGTITVNNPAASSQSFPSARLIYDPNAGDVPAQGAQASGGGYEYVQPTSALGDTYVVEATIPATSQSPQYTSGSITILPTDNDLDAFLRIRDALNAAGAGAYWNIIADGSGPSSSGKIRLEAVNNGTAYNGQNIYMLDIPGSPATDTFVDKLIQQTATTGGQNNDAALAQDVITITSPTNPDIVVTMPVIYGQESYISVINKYIDALNDELLFTAEYTANQDSVLPTNINLESTTIGTSYNGETVTLTNNAGLSWNQLTDTFANGRANASDDYGSGISIFIDPDDAALETETTANIFGLDSEIVIAQKIYNALIGNGNLVAKYDFNLLGRTIEIQALSAGDGDNAYVNIVNQDVYGVSISFTQITGGASGGAVGEKDPVEVGSDPALFSEIGTFTDQRMFHFNAGVDGTTRMAYWENLNEQYPDDEDSQIWAVDANGVGYYTGATLGGENVRHHHFPDFAESPHYDGEDNTNTATILGFRLENIQIPQAIKDQVLGYRVYYAKRTPQNKRILAQSIPTFGFDPIDDLASQCRMADPAAAYNFHDTIQYHHPFDLMIDKPSVGALSHIKIVAQVDPTDATDFTAKPDNYVSVGAPGVLITDSVKRVTAKSYVPALEAVALSNLGFGFDYNGDVSTSKLILQTTSINTIDLGGGNRSNNNYLWNLCQHKTDLYLSFENQELVWTGYQNDDLDSGVSDPIFGGDTFISFYAWKQHSLTVSTETILHRAIVESDRNLGLRHEGAEVYEIYYPKSPEITVLDPPLSGSVTDEREYDNYYAYNELYSSLNDIKPSFPYNRNVIEEYNFPTRVVRSSKDLPGIDGFRIFKENDYLDFPKKRVQVNKIEALNNILLVHTERSLFRTRGREELITSDFRAFLGSGDIFEFEPEEMYATNEGYGGLQHPNSAIVTPFGYFFVDYDARKAFILSDRLNEISTKGLNEFFKSSLPFTGEGDLKAVYDPDLRRILFTKYNSANSFTLSYSPEYNMWISEHDYAPQYYFSTLREFFSVLGPGFETIYRHNTGNRNEFYGALYDFVFEFVSNEEPNISKRLGAVGIQGAVFDTNEVEMPEQPPVTTIQVVNQYQDTGELPVVYFDNTRRTQQTWRINGLRDANIAGKRLEDLYHIVTLTYTNLENRLLSILNAFASHVTRSKR